MPIIVLQHSDTDTIGRLGVALRSHGHVLDVRRPDLLGEAALPKDHDGVSGVVVLGGPQNVGDPLAWMNAEIEFIRATHAKQLPLVGICLGHQLIAHALGGEVGPASAGEFGFVRVTTGVPGQTDTMLAGVPWASEMFSSHACEVKKAPPDSTVLQSSRDCKVQCFRAGLRTYGFQYHFECMPRDVEAHAKCAFGQEMMGRLSLSPEQVRQQQAAHGEAFARLGDRLCQNIAAFMFPLMSKARV